jgi:hypothetical protein
MTSDLVVPEEGQEGTEALRWFRKAADGGDGFAQADLGFMYERRMGRSSKLRRRAQLVPQFSRPGELSRRVQSGIHVSVRTRSGQGR